MRTIGKANLGEIKPWAEYEIIEIENKQNEYKTLLIERDPFTSETKPIGEVTDIISRNNFEKIMEYREQGYWPFRIKDSERVAIVKPIPLYERKNFRNM